MEVLETNVALNDAHFAGRPGLRPIPAVLDWDEEHIPEECEGGVDLIMYVPSFL